MFRRVGRRMVENSICFQPDGGPQIYLLDLDSGNERRLTFEESTIRSPAGPPRGQGCLHSQVAGLTKFS